MDYNKKRISLKKTRKWETINSEIEYKNISYMLYNLCHYWPKFKKAAYKNKVCHIEQTWKSVPQANIVNNIKSQC